MNNLSLSTCYLKMKTVTGAEIATATGFIYEHGDSLYLITNGHNLTGKNCFDGERLDNSAGIPVKIETQFFQKRDGDPSLYIATVPIDLYIDENHSIPSWFMHPDHGYRVDVVAILLGKKAELIPTYLIQPINNIIFDEYDLAVSDDVFILGYPFNISVGGSLPIWKRGSVASEPSISLLNLPFYYIDTATRPGMSGSPVIMQRSGLHSKTGELALSSLIGTIRCFAGIYSGRIGAEDEFKAQLGIVWKKEVIMEILDSCVVGTVEFLYT